MMDQTRWLIGTATLIVMVPAEAAAQIASTPSDNAAAVQSSDASEADAADAADTAEIVVTARKRAERLSKIPETIDAISAEEITRAGITTLNDVGRQTPNIVLNRRQDNEPNVVIRGVGSFGNTQGVGFYVDDVQNFTDQSAAIYDVERIEILKGPQGTLYGGSNVGGAIKYILKRPTDEFGAEGRVEYGTFDTANGFGAVNMPLGTNLALRASGYYNSTDGYVTNVLLGGRVDVSDEWGVRAALGWQPAEGLDVNFSFRHSELDNGGNVYVLSTDADDYKRTVNYNNRPFSTRDLNGGILTLDYDAGSIAATSLTSYTRAESTFLSDLDYSAADAIAIRNGDRNTTQVFTQELRLASSGESAFDWLVGAYYSWIDNRSRANNFDLLLGPAFPGGPGVPFVIEDFSNGDTTEHQYALFGTLNYAFGDFRIGGGLRVARSEFTGRDLNIPASVEVNDTIVLPKVTLAYDVDTDTMLYANLGIGSEPGRVNVRGGGAYKSERATSIEAGLKGTVLDRKLSYDFAVFYIDYLRRQLESRFVAPDGIITEAITNIGRSVSYGAEGGIRYQPIAGLTLALSGGYLHSKWDDEDALFNLAPVDGLRVPNSPKFTGNASLDYRHPIGGALEVGFRADVTHTSSFFWDVPNTSAQDAYDIVNLRLSIGAADRRWEFAIRGENVLDAEYFTEFAPDAFGPGIGPGAPGTPARVIASFAFRF